MRWDKHDLGEKEVVQEHVSGRRVRSDDVLVSRAQIASIQPCLQQVLQHLLRHSGHHCVPSLVGSNQNQPSFHRTLFVYWTWTVDMECSFGWTFHVQEISIVQLPSSCQTPSSNPRVSQQLHRRVNTILYFLPARLDSGHKIQPIITSFSSDSKCTRCRSVIYKSNLTLRSYHISSIHLQ